MGVFGCIKPVFRSNLVKSGFFLTYFKMSVDYGQLVNGSRIHIRRSDGRVHEAIVMALGPGEAIHVEWFENNDTKGKEVDLDMVFELNPQFAPKTTGSKAQGKRVVRPSILITKNQAQENETNGYDHNGKSSRISRPGRSRMGAGEIVPSKPRKEPAARNDMSSIISQESGYDEQPAPAPKPQQRSRRSNVVDEVNKISRNREERRAAQIKERERKNQFYDPNNPNWEFAIMVKEFRDEIEMSPITKTEYVEDHRICVCVRKRPLNRKEVNKREIDVVTVPNQDLLIVSEPKSKVDLTRYLENQKFRFDYSFNESCSNDLVYWYTARPLVQCIFEGGMATCFAYGQTGSGKTHTMGGDFIAGKSQDANRGIYALAARDVFSLLHSSRYRNRNIAVFATFFEIYSGKVFDLLNKKTRLTVLEDGQQQVQIVGLTERHCNSIEDVLQIIQEASKCRTSGTTSANQHSSRSHAVFQIILREYKGRSITGKFSLIDLAGNERGADTTSSSRQTRVEGSEINKSLLALKECIRAMSMKGSHLPFRASKLTQVLRDSFIGEKSRTCMIATISPGMSSCEHTLNTLRYADRVKELRADEKGMNGARKGDDKGSGSRRGDDRSNGPRRSDDNSPKRADLSFIPEEIANSSMTSENDLDMLASTLQENEESVEMFEICKSVSTLQEKEEQLVNAHRQCAELCKEHTQLLEMTNDVEYDSAEYLQRLDENIGDLALRMEVLAETAQAYREALADEEQVSRSIANKHRNHK